MSFLRTAKKEPEEPSHAVAAAAPAAADDEARLLQQLAERLTGLGHSLDEAKQQMVECLLRRQSQPAAGKAAAIPDRALAALDEKLDALGMRLDQVAEEIAAGGPVMAVEATPESGKTGGEKTISDESLRAVVQPMGQRLDQVETKLRGIGEQIEAKFRTLGEQLAANRVEERLIPALTEIHQGIHDSGAAVSNALSQLYQYLDAGLRGIHELLRPPEPDATAPAPVSNAEWQRAVLGDELTDNASLDFQRQSLMDAVLQGDANACGLVGQLLVFRSSPPDKMPLVLKEIGEAYYRWEPKSRPGRNTMEEALVGWLQRCCDAAGVSNTIDLVHPGERFDSTRHNAATRGVEITDVLGWIVLRDNGRVYTKASVAVK